jgi:hypothetical protein
MEHLDSLLLDLNPVLNDVDFIIFQRIKKVRFMSKCCSSTPKFWISQVIELTKLRINYQVVYRLVDYKDCGLNEKGRNWIFSDY